MCLIIHRPAGVGITQNLLSEAMVSNPDGWGIMWAENGKVEVRKSRVMKEFWAAYNAIDPDLEVGIHFRLKTHGAISDAMAHPFEVFGENNKHHGPVWLMHNGIFSHVDQIDTNKSDTYYWIEQIFRPILAPDPQLWHDPVFWAAITADTVGSRLLVLNGDGEFKLTGSWTKENGLSLSNTYFRYSSSYYGGWAGEYDRPFALETTSPGSTTGSGGATSSRRQTRLRERRALQLCASMGVPVTTEDDAVQVANDIIDQLIENGDVGFDQFRISDVARMSWRQLSQLAKHDPDGAVATLYTLLQDAIDEDDDGEEYEAEDFQEGDEDFEVPERPDDDVRDVVDQIEDTVRLYRGA